MKDRYFLFLGVSFAFVAFFQLLHMLAYDGMNIFSTGVNVPTQLWLITRGMFAVSFLIAPFYRGKSAIAWISYSVVSLVLLLSIYFSVFPVAYTTELTHFKIISEYVIILIFMAAIYVMGKKREQFSSQVYNFLVVALIFAIASEIFFTLYSNPFGLFNMFGHLLMFLSSYLIYRAVIVTALKTPYSLLFRDIKQKEEQLQLANSKLRSLHKVKDDFMSAAAHELKNPLTAIIGYAEMLRKTKVNKKEQEWVDIIYQNAWKEKRLVDDILDITKLEGKMMKFEMKEFDITGLLRRTVDEFSPLALEKKIKLSLEIKRLPLLMGDPLRLSQAISNMLNNALKFTDSGSIRLKARADKKDIIVSVSDTGIGISKEDLPHLFTKFYQASSAKRYAGTGLGLAISKEIVLSHNGKVWVESELNKGSTFYFSLPIT